MSRLITSLHLDLSHDVTRMTANAADRCRLEERLGGYGKAVRDIEEYLKNNPCLKDAYDPRNLLCFDIGFLTSSKVATSKRTYVSALSPLKTSKAGTNGIFYSAASGGLGPEIAGCDIDAIRFTGKSEKPVYIVIDGGKTSYEDATNLRGLTTSEKIEALAEKHKKGAFAVVGPAAENNVRFANIAFSTSDQLKKGSKNMRFAGRGGLGTVMASKNLLGIVVKGNMIRREAGDVKELNTCIAGKKTEKYGKFGTFFYNLPSAEALGAGIHNNFSKGSDPRTEALFSENLVDAGYQIKSKGCLGCPIKCWKEICKGNDVLGKIDYEPGSLLGPNLGIYNIDEIMELIKLGDEFGMDTISLGVSLGFAMEDEDRFGDFKFAKNSFVLKCFICAPRSSWHLSGSTSSSSVNPS